MLRPLAVLVVFFTSSLEQVFAADAKSEAARVAIVRYIDKTNTQNFEYMPGSLQEAITQSMKKKFEFIEVNPTKVEPIISQVLAKNKGVMGPKEAAEVCRLADIDILIYGNFTFKQEDNRIVIHTEISLGSTDKFRNIKPTENRVDATIFRAADKVAGDIVSEIAKIAQEQQLAKGEEAKKDAKGKTQLDKTEKMKTWADINWNFGLFAGTSRGIISSDKVKQRFEPLVGAKASYRLRGAWHVGLAVQLNELQTAATQAPFNVEFIYTSAVATGGYYFDLSPRWRWTNDLGLGYYYGELDLSVNCREVQSCPFAPEAGRSVVKNPMLSVRSGIHFLIFSYFSVGLEGQYQMLYDSKPVNVLGASLVLSAIF